MLELRVSVSLHVPGFTVLSHLCGSSSHPYSSKRLGPGAKPAVDQHVFTSSVFVLTLHQPFFQGDCSANRPKELLLVVQAVGGFSGWT